MKAMSVHLSENRVKPINITKTNLNIQWRSGNKIKLLSMLSKCKSFWATHMNQSHISNIMIINRRLFLPKSKLSMCIRPPLAVCVSWFNLWSSMVMAYSPPWNDSNKFQKECRLGQHRNGTIWYLFKRFRDFDVVIFLSRTWSLHNI